MPFDFEVWHKKDVELRWQRQTMSFAVAQELFSSHAVDTGSRLLLDSLQPDDVSTRGVVADFGCGYGVLGLAWKRRKPDWSVRLIDRDALAVDFAAWNAERLGYGPGANVDGLVALGLDSAPLEGFDLILWNVPGKAGESVLRSLCVDVGAGLCSGGLAALVVVNPLAAALRSAFKSRSDLTITRDETSGGHSVLHIKKNVLAKVTEVAGDPFDRGVFDRAQTTFDTIFGRYALIPVTGLPEFESLSFATGVMLTAMRHLPETPGSVLVRGCGQGHAAVIALLTTGPKRFTLVDRDLLALRASKRALVQQGLSAEHVTSCAVSDIGSAALTNRGADTAIIMLEDEMRPAIMGALVQDVEALASAGLQVLVGGGSTRVTRLLALVAKRKRWTQKASVRKHGARAAVLTIEPLEAVPGVPAPWGRLP